MNRRLNREQVEQIINSSRTKGERPCLRWTDLDGMDLNGADLMGVDLMGAELIGVGLIEANLVESNLTGTDLRMANLSGANLSGARLVGVDLRRAKYNDTTMWPTNFDPTQAGAILKADGDRL